MSTSGFHVIFDWEFASSFLVSLNLFAFGISDWPILIVRENRSCSSVEEAEVFH